MKLVSFIKNGNECAGIFTRGKIFDIYMMHPGLPGSMKETLMKWEETYPALLKLLSEIENTPKLQSRGLSLDDVELLAPVPNPESLRDGYAFRQHVETARKNRGLDMTPVFDSFPVFYFGNHHTVQGAGPVFCMPDHFRNLDFELETAIVISRRGKNIPAEQADTYIAGIMILNDFSARVLQMDEMLLNLGPAKGKDFATATGPWLVTLEELSPFEKLGKNGHTGKSWNLKMTASVNGKIVSEGNLAEMDWTFAEIIERASYGAELFPGDIIGSGTVGTGCFLELNGTGRRNDPQYQEQWLADGDEVELQVEGLGSLKNQIRAVKTDWSILKLKK